MASTQYLLEGNPNVANFTPAGAAADTIASATTSASRLSVTQTTTGVTLSNGTNTAVLGGLLLNQLGEQNTNFAGGSHIFYGSDGADTFTGSGGGDFVLLLGGNDVYTAAGSDLIFGGQGNDSLSGGTFSNTTLFGGQGDDVITGSSSTVSGGYIFGNLGLDTITATGTGVSVFGGQGDDVISGSTGTRQYISGDIGNDTISAAGNSATVFGGEGFDSITASGTNALVFGNLGADTIVASGTTGGSIYGGQGNDLITLTTTGAGVNAYAFGNQGSDTISAGSASDSIFGGQGNDLIGGAAGSYLSGDLGSDAFGFGTAGVGAASGATTAASTRVAGFQSGSDYLILGADGDGGNYREIAASSATDVASAITAANNAASNGARDFTFVAGATNGYLVVGDGSTSVITLTGLNSVDRFAATDIVAALPSDFPNT